MGIRFRKSIKVAPGVKLNIGKRGVGVSAGVKGAHVSVNSSGRKTVSAGIPDTGISYVKSSGGSSSKKNSSSRKRTTTQQSSFYTEGGPEVPKNKKPWYQRTGWIIALLILFFPVGLFLAWKYWGKTGKVVATAFVVMSVFGFIAGGGNDTNSINQSHQPTIESSSETEPEYTTNSLDASAETTISETESNSEIIEKTVDEQDTAANTEETATTEYVEMVWISESGSKYHSKKSCSNMNNPRQITIDDAKNMGLSACKKCH